MKHFTVLLLYPDYIADEFGKETYLAHVYAKTQENAVLLARIEAAEDFGRESIEDLEDFHVLALFEGHLIDLAVAR